MRDLHAAATPAEDPTAVLPYDPDDWERRLAEARTRRQAVLARRAQTGDGTATGVAAAPAPAPVLAAPPSRPTVHRPDPAEWRRKLAEARGLAVTGDAPSARIAASQPAATRASAIAPPDPGDLRLDAPATRRSMPHRAGWCVAALAAFGGMAGGVALTIALLGDAGPTVTAVQTTTPGSPWTPVEIAGYMPAMDGLTRPAPAAARLATGRADPDPSIARTAPKLAPPPVRRPPPVPLAAPTAMIATVTPPAMPEVAPEPVVVLHVPTDPAAGSAAVLSMGRAAGWTVVPVDFAISRSHLRVYHATDRGAAAALATQLGLPVRDFVGVVPAPEGLIEVWVAGGPG